MKHTFEKQQPANRLGNALPKIGIRPVIDGRRRGIREAQEERIMGLAHVVADFLTANLKHSCGLPVECVVADTCIAGIAEANMCEEKFAKENVGVSISVTACWCYGSETMDMDPIRPKAIWGLNATEAPGAVYLAAVLAAHAQKGLPAYGIYGHDVQDKDEKELTDDVKEKLLRFAKAALAVATMRGKTYVSMGGTSMGIAGSIVDHDLFQEYLGMRVMHVDMSEFVRRWEEGIYDPEEYEKAIAWAKENLTFGPDFYNEPEKQHSAEKQAEVLETCVKMTMIAKDLMVGNPKLAEMGFVEESMGHNGIAGGFQGQRQWTDHFPNGDLMESLLNSSFDWTGIREPFVLATENDCLNAIAMMFGKLLTNCPTVFADVRTYWSPEAVKRVTGWQPEGLAANGFIHLINSGAAALDGAGEAEVDGVPAMKPWWELSEEEAGKCLDATQYCYANLGYFRGGGFSSHFVSKGGMPVTMIRLNMVKGLGPVLQLAEGWTCELPEEAHHILDMRTDPAWPTTWFAPRLTGEGAFTDVYSVMNNWGANHGAFAYGHIGVDVITLASMLRIPVCMHNVPDEKIFRPSTWNAFGTQDREGADYRACAALGPVYR